MGYAFHQLCPRCNGTLTPTAPTSIGLWETFTFFLNFNIVNFPFLVVDVPRSTSDGVYISQLISFARVSSHVDVFYTRIKVLAEKNFSTRN